MDIQNSNSKNTPQEVILASIATAVNNLNIAMANLFGVSPNKPITYGTVQPLNTKQEIILSTIRGAIANMQSTMDKASVEGSVGDMRKAVYDTNDDGVVDFAHQIDGTTSANQYYGTNSMNAKGFYNLPTGGGGETISPLLLMGA